MLVKEQCRNSSCSHPPRCEPEASDSVDLPPNTDNYDLHSLREPKTASSQDKSCGTGEEAVMVMKLYGTTTTNVQRAILPLFEAEVGCLFLSPNRGSRLLKAHYIYV